MKRSARRWPPLKASPTHPKELLGINSGLSLAELDSCVSLGVEWIRAAGDELNWGKWHFTEQQYQQDQQRGGVWPALLPFQAHVEEAHARGLKVLGLALASPQWVHGAARMDGGYEWHQAPLPQHREKFAEFCYQIALCGADAVEVTNEPNITSTGYWLGPDHPRSQWPDERVDDYVLLLRAVYQRIKTDPVTNACQVGIGGVGAYGHELQPVPEAIHGTTWYKKLFSAKADDRITPVSAAGAFDWAGHHPYSDFGAMKGPIEWDYRDAVYLHGVASVWRVRQILQQYAPETKIWATEGGSPTFGKIDDKTQALWMDQYLKVWLTSDTTGFGPPLAPEYYGSFAGPLFVYQLRDKSDGKIPPTDQEGFFGLYHYSGSEKPSAEVLRKHARV